MDTFAQRPEFVIDPATPVDSAEMLREIQDAINTDPILMSDAFLYTVAERNPKNQGKTPAELAALAQTTSPLDTILALTDMWRDYDDKELWRYVEGFDAATEEVVSVDSTMRDLKKALNNPMNRNKEATQRTIRETRLALYIGRVSAISE
jgi:hypothetical protein